MTHSYINGVTWFLKVLYRCRADHLHLVEKSGPQGEPIRQAREQVLKAIHEGTGLYLDKVNSTGKGGTSTDGNQGRRFFQRRYLNVLKDYLMRSTKKMFYYYIDKYQRFSLSCHHPDKLMSQNSKVFVR